MNNRTMDILYNWFYTFLNDNYLLIDYGVKFLIAIYMFFA